MKNKKGFSPVLIILAVFILIALAVGAYYMKTKSGWYNVLKNSQTSEPVVSTEPVSSSTEDEAIQRELEETDPGSIDADIQVFEKDTLSL